MFRIVAHKMSVTFFISCAINSCDQNFTLTNSFRHKILCFSQILVQLVTLSPWQDSRFAHSRKFVLERGKGYGFPTTPMQHLINMSY